MQVFFPLDPADPTSFTDFSESAEVVAADIVGRFASPAVLRAAGVIRVSQQSVYKARYNSDYGVLFLSYQIVYVHAAGDAYSISV